MAAVVEKTKFGKFELIAAVVGILVFMFKSEHHKPPQALAEAEAPPPAEVAPISKTVLKVAAPSHLASDLKPGALTTSWDGDSCTVMSITNDQHPKEYTKGHSLKEAKLYCTHGKTHYVLRNIGIYKSTKLVWSSRTKIEDGNCEVVKYEKTPVPKSKDLFKMNIFSTCTRKGERVMEKVTTLVQENKKGHKRLLTRVLFEPLIAIKEAPEKVAKK